MQIMNLDIVFNFVIFHKYVEAQVLFLKTLQNVMIK